MVQGWFCPCLLDVMHTNTRLIHMDTTLCRMLWLLLFMLSGHAQAGLSWPVDCIPGDNCNTQIGYPDPDGDGETFDCEGARSIGHEGTDIDISTTVMDAGMDVLAAADGQVLWVFDGKYDRCPNVSETDCNQPNTKLGPGQSQGYRVCTPLGSYCKSGTGNCYLCFDGGNVVVIKHDSGNVGFASRYDHLKRNSIKVRVGDRVTKGQVIAQVGSSGRSTRPHLHFEVWGNTYYDPIDPWAGQCNATPRVSWTDKTTPWSSLMVASTIKPVSGQCGSRNGTSVSTRPTADLCATGTASSVSGNGPWSWTCTGTNGGSSATCSANQKPNSSDCFFNWAEQQYSSFLSPVGATSVTLGDYYYRYYNKTNSYLAIRSSDNHLYFMGPTTGNVIVGLGAVSVWLAQAGCQ